jgi:hypothetical protein
VWFVEAGRVSFIETPIGSRYLSQDARIEIADGLARGERVPVAAQPPLDSFLGNLCLPG